MKAKPQTIDEYLAPLSNEKRAALEKLRRAIKSAAQTRRQTRLPVYKNELEVAPYDSRWPAAFDAEALRLGAVLGTLALRIDHDGSTSIPGLGAKPIIDIQVSVAALQPIAAYGKHFGPSDTCTFLIPTTRFVRSSIGHGSGLTVTTFTSSKQAALKNGGHWPFAITSATTLPRLVNTNTSNKTWPGNSRGHSRVS